MALFDVSIINPESTSLIKQPLETIFSSRYNHKRATYSDAAEQMRASFTPFIASCDAALDKNAEIYLKKLGEHLSKKLKAGYSHTMGWLRARIQVCLLRAVSLCLRGNRIIWKGAGVQDGASIPYVERDC